MGDILTATPKFIDQNDFHACVLVPNFRMILFRQFRVPDRYQVHDPELYIACLKPLIFYGYIIDGTVNVFNKILSFVNDG